MFVMLKRRYEGTESVARRSNILCSRFLSNRTATVFTFATEPNEPNTRSLFSPNTGIRISFSWIMSQQTPWIYINPGLVTVTPQTRKAEILLVEHSSKTGPKLLFPLATETRVPKRLRNFYLIMSVTSRSILTLQAVLYLMDTRSWILSTKGK